MKRYGSDKSDHGFCPFYEGYFGPIREDVKKVLEIGVADGASIRAWCDYFPNAQVYGLDAPEDAVGKYGDAANWPTNGRFLAMQGDQANREHLARLVEHGPWDIVIDDGGHTMEQQQVSLGVLFPHTTRFYVVEDLHTSFMEGVTIYDPNGPKRSYPTGVGIDPCTTHDLLTGAKPWHESPHMSVAECNYMDGETWPDVIHVFDRDGDHKHITSMIGVR
jgi:hypothetical protein